VIKISFSGETVSVLDEMKAFINSIDLSPGEKPEETSKIGGPTRIRTWGASEDSTTSSGQKPGEDKTPKSNIKSRAGRPPMSEEEKMQAKAVRTQKLLEEMAEAKADLNKQTPPAILAIEDAPKITKEALTESITTLFDKLKHKFGPAKAREEILKIYGRFDVTSLGELEEKRYQELLKIVQAVSVVEAAL